MFNTQKNEKKKKKKKREENIELCENETFENKKIKNHIPPNKEKADLYRSANCIYCQTKINNNYIPIPKMRDYS